MDATLVSLPSAPKYGAVELKEYIRKSTVRGFIATIALLLLLFLIWFGVNAILAARLGAPKAAPKVGTISLQNLPPPPADAAAPPPIPPAAAMEISASGPPVRAGNPVPIPDAQIGDLEDIASVDVQSRAHAEAGTGPMEGSDIGLGLDVGQVNIGGAIEQEPDPDEFVAVEKEPGVDLGDLKKRIVYPDMARRANIEGKVTIQILVGKDGKPKKFRILDGPQPLHDAASKAAMSITYTPAIQNGSPIDAWVSIPVQFSLH